MTKINNRTLKRRLSRGNHDSFEIITNVIPSFRSLFLKDYCAARFRYQFNHSYFCSRSFNDKRNVLKTFHRRYQSAEPSAHFQLFVAAAVLRKFKRNVTLFQQSNSSLCTRGARFTLVIRLSLVTSSLRLWWCANGLRSTTVFIRTRTISYCTSNINRVERKRSLDKYLQTICNTIKFHPIHS